VYPTEEAANSTAGVLSASIRVFPSPWNDGVPFLVTVT